MRFVADAMLGKLARWLRLSGYPVHYSRSAADEELLRRAEREGAVLLTRDQALAERARSLGLRSVYVKSGDIEEQMLQLGRELGVRYEKTPAQALCPVCNGSLEEAAPEEVADDLPPAVVESGCRIYRCSSCGKLYWHGRHWKNIADRVVRVEGRLSSSE
ncbi:MAG: hypothetical protein GXO66_08880 [Euryarchaeota archaeon]|nr:hypothetical protein [Euryarchaeota archaeon]